MINSPARVPFSESYGRWLSLVWLVFLSPPLYGLFQAKHSSAQIIYGLAVIALFVAIFVWVFFGSHSWEHDKFPLIRGANIFGMVFSYIVFFLLYPVISWYGIGMFIYAGSFAGRQRSFTPSIVAMSVSALAAVVCALLGLDWISSVSIPLFTAVATLGNHISYQETVASKALQRSQEEVSRIAKIAERERIARDLHDLLGHTLSVIVLKSELAGRIGETNPEKALKEIREVEKIARDSLQEVRSAVRGYRSRGLEGEIQGVKLACEAAGLKLELFQMPVALEWSAEQALSFVLREAVTNAIRYATARTLWVSIEKIGNNVRLSVWDDGSGKILEGNGIRGMRERAQALGGTLEINPSFKGVTATLPLPVES